MLHVPQILSLILYALRMCATRSDSFSPCVSLTAAIRVLERRFNVLEPNEMKQQSYKMLNIILTGALCVFSYEE